jgi:colanic acid/amylovoran biosynthesis protein
MIDRTDAGTARWYTDALISCARHCARLGLRPVLLAHETGDLELARSIAAGSGLPADVVREPDPLRAKALVGRSAFAVGSRYHGLVNALSQGVPGLAIGWCHKYLALLDDYDCPECLVRLNAPVQDLERQIDDVVREPVRQDLVHRIGEARKRVLSSIDDMWNQIRDVLRPCEFSSSPSSSPR